MPSTEADRTPALEDRVEPLKLRRSPLLRPLPPGTDTGGLPVFLRADRIEGSLNGLITADGNAELRQRGITLLAEQLRYLVPDERCMVDGSVAIERGLDRVTGPRGEYHLRDQSGNMLEPDITFAAGPGRPRASRATASLAVFVDASHDRLEQAAYTSCKPGQDDWFLTGSVIELNHETQIGQAYNGRILFQGVPILYSPYLSFPLTDERKSGFLAPTIGTTGTNGFDYTQPYYFNIAPNLDDTVTARVMSKRGLEISNEFRYLEPSYRGVITAELLNRDILAGERRYFLGALHDQLLPEGIKLHINAQEVSDSNYFRDLSTTVGATATSYLARDFGLSEQIGHWNLGVRALSYQTVRDPVLVIPDQYRERPQITANWAEPSYGGTQLNVQNEFVDFHGVNVVQGQRAISYPAVSLPLTAEYGFLTPKVGYHLTEYQLNVPTAGGSSRFTRTLPITSLDGGLYFDRSTQLFSQDFSQTLEPRLYYLRVPTRDQTQLPVFNTALAEFNYTQLFSENRYSGPDRISDANSLSAVVQSRLIDPENGVERAKGFIGQRFNFTSQRVTLPGEQARTGNVSDYLVGVSGRIDSHTTGEFTWDYNPELHRTEKFTAIGRFNPQPGQALNVGYRINRDTPGQPDIRQIDVSGEWPLYGHWTGVFRVDYDTARSTLVEGVLGAEYTAGCWTFRVVSHRLAVSTVQTTSALFFQLELNGLARLGTNPIDTLRLNIPGYAKTNEILR